MRRPVPILMIFLSVSFFLTACSSAIPGDQESIQISGSWIRPARIGENSAIYMEITNNSRDAITLTAVEVDFARMAQLHQTQVENDIASMHHLNEGIIIDAGTTLALEPGSFHIMLMNITDNLDVGQEESLTLVFDTDQSIEVQARVQQNQE